MTSVTEFAYRSRGILMAPFYVILVTVFFDETENDAWIWSVGLTLFFSGVAIRVWAQTHLHYRLRTHKVLTLTGPYTYVRNPIYIANTTMLIGLTVVSELLWFVPIMLVWCFVLYSVVVRREEQHLTEKYGEPYRAFMTSVPRWLPHFVRPQSGREIILQYLPASLIAEAHCMLLLVPLIAKEWYSNVN